MSIRKWILTGTGTFLLLPAIASIDLFAASNVATIDMARVLRSYGEVRKAVGVIKEKKDEYQKVIDGLQDEIKTINNEIQQDKEKGKDTKEKEAAKRKKIYDLQQKYQGLRDKLDKLEAEEFDQIKDRIRVTVDKLAASKGVELVIEKQWLYYGAATDLTDELLSALGGGAPAGGRGGKKPATKAPAEE
ncbi:MAG: OmpH family outer membrane protein [Candidatus Wallbacteria bacterium]|nr:OmpH family outer membrane protein [Candidatus Wallbacteria bacterium]MBI4865315.1 OmpH family outer membrane protein [Candidatus Wallbacteria bacterium]